MSRCRWVAKALRMGLSGVIVIRLQLGAQALFAACVVFAGGAEGDAHDRGGGGDGEVLVEDEV